MRFGALSLTDENGLYGVPRFLRAAGEAGVSPIVGAEVLVEAPRERRTASRLATGRTVQLRKGASEGASRGNGDPGGKAAGPDGSLGGHLVLLAESMEGYRNLSHLISLYRTRPSAGGGEPSASERRNPSTTLEDVCSHAEGLVCLTGALPFGLIPALLLSPDTGLRGKAGEVLALLREAFRDRLYVELTDDGTHGSRRRMRLVEAFAEAHGVPTVAAHEVLYLRPQDHRLHEVLRAASALLALPPPGYRPTDRLFLRYPEQLARLFADRPEALRRNAEVAERCAGAVRMGTPAWGGRVLLPEARGYPGFPGGPVSGGRGSVASPEARRLAALVGAGARRRYPEAFRGELDAFPDLAELKGRLRKELSVILSMGMGGYFLIAHEAVAIARERGIPVTGRGSAGNSCVAHCLGLTAPEPFRHRLVFERFLHLQRADPPDVDLDFASGPSGRDAVRQELMRRYGGADGAGAAVAANFDTYSLRGGVRAAARALGYSASETNELAKNVPRHLRDRDPERPLWEEILALPEMRSSPLRSALEEGRGTGVPDKRRAADRHRLSLLMDLAERLEGRLKGPGTHLGGLVFGTPAHHLAGIAPMEHSGTPGLPRVQWDRDSLELAGLPKLDLLGLRTHSALRDAGISVGRKLGRQIDPLSPPPNDRETYRMIRAARTVSCFQVESPGQQALQRRLGARTMDDLVHAISLHRPGPIAADMVTPYVLRRNGLEAYSVPLPHLLDDVLRQTYGLLLFQESVMEVVHRVAGYSLAQADGFRRAMTKDRDPGAMRHLEYDFLRRAAERGVPPADAELVFSWVESFSVYGFPKSHAAAFAETAYATAYMLRHHPAEWLPVIYSASTHRHSSASSASSATAAMLPSRPPMALSNSCSRSVLRVAGTRSVRPRSSMRLRRWCSSRGSRFLSGRKLGQVWHAKRVSHGWYAVSPHQPIPRSTNIDSRHSLCAATCASGERSTRICAVARCSSSMAAKASSNSFRSSGGMTAAYRRVMRRSLCPSMRLMVSSFMPRFRHSTASVCRKRWLV
jgi:error-prone DNA polymerase